jgi:hypothetical protein
LLLSFLHIRRHLASLFEEKHIHIKRVSAIDKNNEKGNLQKGILKSCRKRYIYIWNKSIISANVPLFQPSSQRTKRKTPFGFDLKTNFQNEIMTSLRLRLGSVLNIITPIINKFITSFNRLLNMKFDKREKRTSHSESIVQSQRERERERERGG